MNSKYYGSQTMLENKLATTAVKNIVKNNSVADQSGYSEYFNPNDSSSLKKSINKSIDGLETHLNVAAKYHFERPGKQIRGLLGLSSCKCLDVNEKDSLNWATAVELLHNASLIHDDICDKDQNRRGQPSIFAKYGEQTALCLGDAIVSLSFQLSCLNDKPQDMVRLFSDRMLGAVSGQACERNNVYPDWLEYLEITRGKTSSLLSLPIEGALILSKNSESCPQVKTYFDFAGPIFQIINDIRNFDGSDGAQHTFSDLWDCRPNAIISLFRSYLKNGSVEIFDSWVGDRRNNQNESDQTKLFNYWRDKIIDSPSRADLIIKLDDLYEESQLNLENFPTKLNPMIDSFNAWLTTEVRSIKNTPYFNINPNKK